MNVDRRSWLGSAVTALLSPLLLFCGTEEKPLRVQNVEHIYFGCERRPVVFELVEGEWVFVSVLYPEER